MPQSSLTLQAAADLPALALRLDRSSSFLGAYVIIFQILFCGYQQTYESVGKVSARANVNGFIYG